LGQIGAVVGSLKESVKIRKGLWIAAAAIIIFQAYFVRELLAAELLFGLAFAFLLALGGVAYLLGTIGERSLDWTESGVRIVATSARRSFAAIEELGRTFRRLRSQSAQ
jgi:hypothetical protein